MTQLKIASDSILFLLSITVEVRDLQEVVRQLQAGVALSAEIREGGAGTISESFNQESPQILADYRLFLESMTLAANKFQEGLVQFQSRLDAANADQEIGAYSIDTP